MSSSRLAENGVKQEKGELIERKEIVTLLYKPNHSLFQLAFRAEIASSPLKALSDALRGLGIQILNASVSSLDGRIGSWNVFLDSPNFAVTADAIRPKLAAISSFTDLRMTKGDELVVEGLYFPLTLSGLGSRVMLITQDSFQRMLAAMDQLFGSGESVIAFQEGAALGSIYAGGLRTLIKGDIRRFLVELVKLYGRRGSAGASSSR